MARKARKAISIDNTPNSVVLNAVRAYRTAIYVRLSVEDIRKKISDSIGTQKNMLLQFVRSQPDLELYRIYEDVNYTGTNFDRPGFTAMIEDIQAGAVDCVIVKDLSRFGRSFEETGHYLERVFPFLQVRFIAVNDGYDSLTATIDETSLVVPLKNLMNEVYARDISKKSQSSYKLKQKRGEFCGSFAPYGYIKVGHSLVLDEEVAPVVKQIFLWIAEGKSDIAITQKLNDLKILPPSRYRFEKGITKAKKHEQTKFWYKSAIKRISENPVYTGVLAQGKYQSNFLHGGGRIEKSRDEWLMFENAYPAIIDRETFEVVQNIRLHRMIEAKDRLLPVNDENGGENIFKGLIFCADCKTNMLRHKLRRAKGNIEYCFLCNVYEQVDKNACSKKNINETDIRGILFACISRQIRLAVDISRMIKDIRKSLSYREQYNLLDKEINELKRKLQQNHRFRGSLREDYVDGILSEQDYITMKSDYENEREQLQNTLETLNSEKYRSDNMLSDENKWIAAFRRFENESYLSAQMVSALVDRIEVTDSKNIMVYFRYRDEMDFILNYLGSMEQRASAANE